MKRYPAYKDSEVRWIGKIPKHWSIERIKYSDAVFMGQSPSSEDYNDSKVGLPFLQGNADFSSLHPVPRIWCDTAKKTALPGDVLLSVRAPIGAVNIADQNYGIGRGLCAIRAQKTDSKLLFYIALSINEELNSLGTGSTYTAISIDDVGNTPIPSIKSIEQESIVKFLNHKTHLIDTLIEKKQKQIELLQEQRSAIINQAVTKGLNPNVKMKDSGIEWIGNIPEGWDLRRGSTLGFYSKGKGIKKEEIVEEGEPCIRYGEIYTKYDLLVSDVSTYITEETCANSVSVYPGNLFMTGSGETSEEIGKCVVFLGPGKLWVGGDVIILKPKKDINPLFLSYLINSECIRVQREIAGKGEIIVHIYPKNFKEMRFPIPPENEQNQIVEYLEKLTKSIDLVIEKEAKRIEFIEEYRTTLISEVVTGKIDVRDEVIQ